ncbi:hypothetical protein [Phytohabitans rumicis]|nr:hypothetical protein [Phytohabitans rumicis]
MVSVVTAVLAGSGAGLLAAVVTDRNPVAAFVAGGLVALAALAVLLRIQAGAWDRASTAQLFTDD